MAVTSWILWHHQYACFDREEDVLLGLDSLHFVCLHSLNVNVGSFLCLFNFLPIDDSDVTYPSSPRMLHVTNKDSRVRLLSEGMKALGIKFTSWFLFDLSSKWISWSNEAFCETSLVSGHTVS